MFDFERWCQWADKESGQIRSNAATVEFVRGKPSPKPGAAVNFKGTDKLLQLAFWVTGEADFFGLDTVTGADIMHFEGRMLSDSTFEQTYRDCLAAAQ